MELENKVCSFRSAERLKELGVKQESLFYWRKCIEKDRLPSIVYTKGKIISNDYWSAFTASELLNILPAHVNTQKNEPFNNFRIRLQQAILCESTEPLKCVKSHFINYYCDTTSSGENAWMERTLYDNQCHDVNICNALAKMLILLIEDGFIKCG
ncbi:MAG TPA: hypothetical protein VJ279_08350 [Hanamia sp.]|jgi:hypothetical protein|nr:hypothetical protein [Hanamia sp.]